MIFYNKKYPILSIFFVILFFIESSVFAVSVSLGDSWNTCIKSADVSSRSGIIYASIDPVGRDRILDQIETGELSKETLKLNIGAPFLEAYTQRIIRSKWDSANRSYNFSVPVGSEEKWACYFQNESKFFQEFFDKNSVGYETLEELVEIEQPLDDLSVTVLSDDDVTLKRKKEVVMKTDYPQQVEKNIDKDVKEKSTDQCARKINDSGTDLDIKACSNSCKITAHVRKSGISIFWSEIENTTKKDWIGLVPMDEKVWSDGMLWSYTNGESKGNVILDPKNLTAGDYRVIFYRNNAYKEACSKDIVILP